MSLISYDIDYSIIICTCNPDDRLLKRCLNAVCNLDTDGVASEVILVDNNSLIPIDTLPFVREYLRKTPSMKLMLVAVKGVNNARLAAISEAKGKYIIYIESDSEPGRNYLQELKKLNTTYPEVAAIGPGDVTVDFIDNIEKNIETYARIAFQERHEEAIKFSGVREWQPFYPFGTGLCTYTFLLKEYTKLAKQGRFAIPGKGTQVTCGEDTQMVLFCISKGYFAGVSPTLKVTHIIPASLANEKYLQRLVYGTGLCYESCLAHVFPEYTRELQQERISESKFSGHALKKFIKARFNPDPENIFDLIQFIAENTGVYLALHKPVPAIVRRIVRHLKLD